MFALLQRSSPPPRNAVAPADTRVYAIGDVHGRADLLLRLLDSIAADMRQAIETRIVAVFLGDFVDRGPMVRETLDLLSGTPLPGAETRFLLGNHEAMMLRFLDEGSGLQEWLAFGGDASLFSYGVPRPAGGYAKGSPAELRALLQKKMPARHQAFLRSLRFSYQLGALLFVHAGLRPGIPLARQARADLIGIREPFLSSQADHGAVVVHGHSVRHRPEVLPNRVCVDTGAYATGVLSAAVFSPYDLRFLSSRSAPPGP